MNTETSLDRHQFRRARSRLSSLKRIAPTGGRTLSGSFIRHRLCSGLRCAFILTLLLSLLIALTPAAQAKSETPADRIAELHTITPTVKDSLSQDIGSWGIRESVSSSVFFQQNALHVYSRTVDKNDPQLTVTQSELPVDAFFAEVEARHVEGSLFNGFGFYIAQAPDDFYLFFVSNNGYAAIQHFASGDHTDLVPWQKSAAILTGSHSTNLLRLLLEDGQATLFANGTEVAAVGGLPSSAPTLGLAVSSYQEAKTEMAFRNLRYWNLNDLSTAQPASADEIKAQLASAALTVDDLSPAFGRMPNEDMQTLLDSFISGTQEPTLLKSIDAFAFGDPFSVNIVGGVSGQLTIPPNGVINEMAQGMRQEPTVETLDLDQVGDESVALTATTGEGSEKIRMDFLVFRRGQILAVLFVGYPEGAEPTVTLSDLAHTWDSRIANLVKTDSMSACGAPDCDPASTGPTALSEVESTSL